MNKMLIRRRKARRRGRMSPPWEGSKPNPCRSVVGRRRRPPGQVRKEAAEAPFLRVGGGPLQPDLLGSRPPPFGSLRTLRGFEGGFFVLHDQGAGQKDGRGGKGDSPASAKAGISSMGVGSATPSPAAVSSDDHALRGVELQGMDGDEAALAAAARSSSPRTAGNDACPSLPVSCWNVGASAPSAKMPAGGPYRRSGPDGVSHRTSACRDRGG